MNRSEDVVERHINRPLRRTSGTGDEGRCTVRPSDPETTPRQHPKQIFVDQRRGRDLEVIAPARLARRDADVRRGANGSTIGGSGGMLPLRSTTVSSQDFGEAGGAQSNTRSSVLSASDLVLDARCLRPEDRGVGSQPTRYAEVDAGRYVDSSAQRRTRDGAATRRPMLDVGDADRTESPTPSNRSDDRDRVPAMLLPRSKEVLERAIQDLEIDVAQRELELSRRRRPQITGVDRTSDATVGRQRVFPRVTASVTEKTASSYGKTRRSDMAVGAFDLSQSVVGSRDHSPNSSVDRHSFQHGGEPEADREWDVLDSEVRLRRRRNSRTEEQRRPTSDEAGSMVTRPTDRSRFEDRGRFVPRDLNTSFSDETQVMNSSPSGTVRRHRHSSTSSVDRGEVEEGEVAEEIRPRSSNVNRSPSIMNREPSDVEDFHVRDHQGTPKNGKVRRDIMTEYENGRYCRRLPAVPVVRRSDDLSDVATRQRRCDQAVRRYGRYCRRLPAVPVVRCSDDLSDVATRQRGCDQAVRRSESSRAKEQSSSGVHRSEQGGVGSERSRDATSGRNQEDAAGNSRSCSSRRTFGRKPGDPNEETHTHNPGRTYDKSRGARARKTSKVRMQKDSSSGDSSSGDQSSDDECGRNEKRRRRKDRSHRKPRRRSHSSSDGGSRSVAYGKPKTWLKPEKFDGRSSFETFMYSFENCARYNKWNREDKAAHLRWSLTGIAAQLLWDTENLDYDGLLERLRSRFGGRGIEERFQTELRCRRRAKGESLRELEQDIRRLMSLAYPGEKSTLADHIARDAFLVALDDSEFELKIREREPVDLETAVKIAQRFEVSKAVVEASTGVRHRITRQITESGNMSRTNTGDLEARMVALERQLQLTSATGQSKPNQKGRGEVSEQARRRTQNQKHDQPNKNRAISKEDQSWRDDLLQKIRELEAEQSSGKRDITKLVNENEALNKEVGRLKHLNELRSTTASSIVQPIIDHGSQEATRFSPVDASKRGSVCWTCGETGHFSRDHRQGPELGQFHARTQPRTQAQHNTSAGLRVAGTVSRHNGQKKRATYIHATVDGQEHNCLLDTGSEVSLLPASLVRSERIQPTTRTLRAANGTEIGVLGEATVSFQTRYFSSTVTGLVSDHIVEVMLGIDWLSANKAIWNFQSATIRLGGRNHQLQLRRGEWNWCRRVVLQEDVEIPARSQLDVNGKVLFRGRPSSEDNLHWGTRPAVISKGLYVARTLTAGDRFTNLPVRVMNVQCQPVAIKAGTVISDLEPLTVIGSSVQVNCPSLESRSTEAGGENGVPRFVEDLVDDVDPATPESTVSNLKELLVRHAKSFSQSENDLGRTNAIAHHIDTDSAKPIRQQLRRYPPAHVEAISNHVDSMLAQGIIQPASSPWASNVVLVRKKDSSYRCCIDYRQLNAVTKRDAYPLPRIDACLDSMSEARWFSTFDLRSSYHQVPVAEEDTDKTAFICPRGMYKFKMMPFGLCNAGATFQRLMDVILSGLHPDVCLVYLDDIIVHSKTTEQHLERLEAVFTRLSEAGLKLKPEKCRFFQRSVSFLGHVISYEGIATDPEKTRAVAEWPPPSSVKELRAFVGLASYYRRFVRDFAKIAAPLHVIMKKNQRFHWNDEAQKAFDELKLALTSPPILAMPNDLGEFVLDTDASDRAIGAVLSQRQNGVERVVAYASRALDRREQNYCVTRKELLAVVHFLRHFKQYLLGREFKVRTDHAALTWLRHTPDPVGQQARWLEQMEEYDFVVEHRAGRSHSNADGLSRHPCYRKECRCHDGTAMSFGGPADRQQTENQLVATIRLRSGKELSQKQESDISHRETSAQDDQTGDESLNDILPWSAEGIRDAQLSDPDIGVLVQLMESSSEQPDWETVALKSSDVKTLWRFWPRLAVRDGVLMRRFESSDGKTTTWQIVFPKSLRPEFLHMAHGGMTGGHMGLKKTAEVVQMRAYWPTWSSDVSSFVKRCLQCARYHRGAPPRQAEMQTPQVGEPWERVSVDITGPHPKSTRQNQYILTVVDHFSKWAEAIPIRNRTATVVAKALMVHVISKYGAPLQLLSDCGPEFESELFSELMKWLEIDKVRTTGYKPSTNGVCERFHRTLNAMLGKVVSDSQRDWDDRLPLVMAAYRASPHCSTGFTPNRLFLGRENRMPLDLVMGLSSNDENRCTTLNEFVAHQQEMAEDAYVIARECLRVAAERRKRSYDIRVKKVTFNRGDWVWYYYPRRYSRKSPKWQKMYSGPYLIVRTIPPVNYVLQKTPRSVPFVVHADKLKKCLSVMPTSWLGEQVVDDKRSTGVATDQQRSSRAQPTIDADEKERETRKNKDEADNNEGARKKVEETKKKKEAEKKEEEARKTRQEAKIKTNDS